MAKQRRGKYLKATTPDWRGTCPLCGRKRVKLAWTANDSAGNKVNVVSYVLLKTLINSI